MGDTYPSSNFRLAVEQYVEAIIAAIIPFAATWLIWPFVDLSQHGVDWQDKYAHPDSVWYAGAAATVLVALAWPLALPKKWHPVAAAIVAGAATGLAIGLLTGAAYFAVGGRP